MKTAPELPGLTYLQHLGTGGYADVHLYEQRSPKMNVAVKVLKADSVDDGVRAQFTAEADVMARLSDHPYIVPVVRAAITDDGRPYIVMKYYPKPNLAVRARRGQFSVPDVLRIGIQICSAVETAHRAGILHRDIKPANILTSQYDEPGLTDFGISAVTTADGTTAAEGMSISWAAPEVLFGLSDGDVRSDVYALGATLWHLLAGRPPYEEPRGDNTDLALMRRTQNDRIPLVPRDGTPETLQRLLRQALAKNPDGRQQSALTLARGLQSIEQELRLPVTATVIPEDRAVASPLDDEPDEPKTMVRGARVVHAQPQPQPSLELQEELPTIGRAAAVARPVAPPHTDTAAAGGPRPRVAPPREPAPEPTSPSRVARVSSEPEAPAASLPTANGRGRAAAVAAGVVAVLAVAGGVVVASSGHGTSSRQTTEADQAGDVQQVVDPNAALAPGTPMVTVRKLSSGLARFTISYDNSRPGDALKWTRVGAGTPALGLATHRIVDLHRPACITVRAVRPSGLSSAASAPLCAA